MSRVATVPGLIICADRRSMPIQVRKDKLSDSGTRADFAVLLVSGAVGDYKAYRGMGDDEWIIRHGDPLTYKEALAHFPVGLSEERYRV